jgi:crotonobetainyl-CoA:carnitine CoA-transferase CaiB-like acyl-CoA transferase
VDEPQRGKVQLVNSPVEFSETPATVERPGPEVGHHNEDILGELGYSRGQIQKLRQKRVIL